MRFHHIWAPGPGPGRATLMLVWLVLLAPWPCMSQQTVMKEVSTGQELADAVAEWGATGTNVTVHITVPYISLRNVTFRNVSTVLGLPPFSTGLMSIWGQPASPSQPATILDTGMRADLIPGITGSAKIEVYNLIMLNLCELPLVALGIALPPTIATPYNLGLFGGSSLSTNRKLVNITMYGRHAAFMLSVYAAMLQRTLQPDIRDTAAALIGMSGLLGAPSDEFSPYVQGVRDMTTADTIWENYTMISLDNPSDPLLNLLRAQQRLMPAQFCAGGLYPEPLNPAAYRMWSPLWMTDSQPTFTAGLEQAAARTALPVPVKGLPVILAHSKTRVFAPPTGTFDVSGRLLLSSPFAGTLQSYSELLPLDMAQRVNLLNILPSGQLILQFLALVGLAATVPTKLPPSLAGTPTSSLLPSVFPLAAFNTSNSPDTWATSSQVVLLNASLAIPPDDYMAFLLMAAPADNQPACIDNRIHQLAAQLKAGISQLIYSASYDSLPRQPYDRLQELMIRSLVGWGMNATLLRLVPTSPVVIPTCTAAAGHNSLTRAQIIGIAVGLSSAVVIGAVAALAVWRHHHNCGPLKTASSVSSAPGSHLGCIQTGSHKGFTATTSLTHSYSDDLTTAHSSARLPASALSLFMQQTAASRHRMFESALELSSVDELHVRDPSPVVSRTWARNPLTDSEDEKRMKDHVTHMANKLSGADQLLLSAVLGTGNCGTVYMGSWRGLKVAVKTFIFHEQEDPDQAVVQHGAVLSAQQRAVMETAIAASVGHRNLVATYHYDIKPLVAQHSSASDGGLKIDMASGSPHTENNAYKLFLVQELCDSSLLYAIQAGLISRSGPGLLPMADLIVILADVAQGLAYLHSMNIIHGDLKPENVLLKVDKSCPQGVVAKLTDFGLSTRLGPDATHVSNYSSGTPFYVAPEVTMNRQAAPASDLYAFGVIMWELYTGQAPFVKTEAGFVWNKLFPSFDTNDLPPPEYHLLCNRCLQHKPQVRPCAQDAVNVLLALLGLISTERQRGKTTPSSSTRSRDTPGAASPGGTPQVQLPGLTAVVEPDCHVTVQQVQQQQYTSGVAAHKQ